MGIREEGLLCGGSSGCAMTAALKAAKSLGEGQRCVVVLPDSVRNYMTKFLSDDWMEEHDFIEPSDHGIDSKFWWWNKKVSSLNLQSALTVLPSITCQGCIDIM